MVGENTDRNGPVPLAHGLARDQHGQPNPGRSRNPHEAALLTCLPGALCLYQGE